MEAHARSIHQDVANRLRANSQAENEVQKYDFTKCEVPPKRGTEDEEPPVVPGADFPPMHSSESLQFEDSFDKVILPSQDANR